LRIGETAKQIFERARLPNDVLGKIWNLSDTKQRGQLDATDFIIAMHMLTSFKTGAMRGIPSTLPAGLYEAASRRGLGRTPTGSGGGLGALPPVPAIPTQFTGSQRTQSPLSRPPFSPLSAQSTGAEWLVNPQEKAQFDNIFATVDTAKAGIISGDQAVAFFTNAQLPEDVLAQIWDLADIDADGQLTKDEFAVAMYLVRQQRGKKEPLPATLPPALIPPSMRRPEALPAKPVAVAPPPPAPAPLPRSAADDLFGLDTFSAPAAPAAPAPTQFPQSTGGSNAPFQSPGSPASRTSQQGPPASVFKPFVPSSHFGQSLNPQLTGAGAAKSPPPPSDDLLGDNDPEETKKLTNETTELANLSNQIGTLSKEMQNVQSQRASAEQEITQSSQQKRDFEARLAQARSMYEKELKDFKALEVRLNASRAETKKLQQDYALIEGSRQDLQNQFDQVSAALVADQSENVTLKEKIRQANLSVSQLKPALEKARSDARQQKGLAAINKKQLATVEGEREKIQGEIDALAKEALESPPESVSRQVTGASSVASPALSAASQQTNPFFRRTTETSDRIVSPAPSNPQAAFDSLFGPSSSQPSIPTPPPPTSFGAASPFAPRAQDASPSPNHSGVSTPSVSPPPQATAEPPAPSQSRQITPSFLPLEGSIQAPSNTTSTAVPAPASRFGAPEVSEAWTLSRNGSASALAETEKPAAQSPFDEVPATIPHVEESATSPAPQPVPAALSPEVSGESQQPTPEKSKEQSFDELFGTVSRQRSQSQKASDFDEAFAEMKPRGAETTTTTNGGGEFPPIREFENDDDDDDDSTDSEEPLGFDDNFTPASPPRNEEHYKNESIDSAQLQAFPIPGSSVAPSQPPPAADVERSPPSYETSTVDQQPDGFPQSYQGLLPSREDPTVAPDAPHAVESSSGAPIVAGEAQKKAGPADFDAAFADLNLAPAKEDESDDDEDEEPQSHQTQNNGFDFSFAAPPSQSAAVSSPAPAANTAAADFFNFDSNFEAPASTSNAAANAKPSPAGDHDWNALFAPLDNATAPSPQAAAASSNGAPTQSPTAANDSRQPGWALENDTDEDDYILKRLTGMGFPRDESLAALEKFDYNIDKVS
jgi:epidermal growth factor receptor substrate 15